MTNSQDVGRGDPQRFRASGRSLAAIVPVTIALVSLLFSLFIWWDNNRVPTVHLTPPSIARLVQNGAEPWIYLQPHFIASGASDQVQVFDALQIELQPAGSGEAALFHWDEEGTWVYDHATRALTWNFLADPHPLVVSAGNPQSPIGLFIGPSGWIWQEGVYDGRLTAVRDNGESVVTDFRLTIQPQAIAIIVADPRNFAEAPVEER